MSKDCNKLIERYNEFVKINNENINKLDQHILKNGLILKKNGMNGILKILWHLLNIK